MKWKKVSLFQWFHNGNGDALQSRKVEKLANKW